MAKAGVGLWAGAAPMGFVPKGWLPFVFSAEDKVSRRFWELALL